MKAAPAQVPTPHLYDPSLSPALGLCPGLLGLSLVLAPLGVWEKRVKSC